MHLIFRFLFIFAFIIAVPKDMIVGAKPSKASSGQSAAQDPFQDALKKLTDKDPNLRRQAAEILGQMRNPSAKDALLKVLTDTVPAVRRVATDSLGIMRILSASTQIAQLLETDKDPSVRQTAAIALGYIADSKTVVSLIKGIQDSHEGTRFACINSLGILRDSSAIGALVKELKNPDVRMRTSASYALGNIGDKKAVTPLLETLKLARSTSTAPEVQKWVDAPLGFTIIRSLGQIEDRTVILELKPFLKDSDKRVQITTAQTLFKLGDNAGLQVARQLVSNIDSYCRRIAAELLGEMGDEKDLIVLKKMSSDPDRYVQQAINRSIEKLSKKVSPSKPKKNVPVPSKKTKS